MKCGLNLGAIYSDLCTQDMGFYNAEQANGNCLCPCKAFGVVMESIFNIKSIRIAGIEF